MPEPYRLRQQEGAVSENPFEQWKRRTATALTSYITESDNMNKNAKITI